MLKTVYESYFYSAQLLSAICKIMKKIHPYHKKLDKNKDLG